MTGKSGQDGTASVQSVQRALSLLIAIGESAEPLALTDLVRQSGLHPATAHRLQKELVASGLVVQDATTLRYHLGPRFLQIANTYRNRREMPEIALPFLEALSTCTGETTGLLELDGTATVVVARVLAPHPLHVAAPIGARGPLHATAGGKVFLAYMSPGERAALLADPLTAFTLNTLTDLTALHEDLAGVRSDGYSVAVEDYQAGVSTLAAPVYGVGNHVVAVLSIPGPTNRVLSDQLPELIDQLMAAARDLSISLGASWKQAQGGEAAWQRVGRYQGIIGQESLVKG